MMMPSTACCIRDSPQYKRISAFQGDMVWQAPRRYFLQHLNGTAQAWAYSELDQLSGSRKSFL